MTYGLMHEILLLTCTICDFEMRKSAFHWCYLFQVRAQDFTKEFVMLLMMTPPLPLNNSSATVL